MSRKKKEIEPPKSIQEYNSWTKRKRINYLNQIRINEIFFDDVEHPKKTDEECLAYINEDIKFQNLTIEEQLNELLKY